MGKQLHVLPRWKIADWTFYHTQSQYIDTRLTSPSADPIVSAPGRVATRLQCWPGKICAEKAGMEPSVCCSQGGCLQPRGQQDPRSAVPPMLINLETVLLLIYKSFTALELPNSPFDQTVLWSVCAQKVHQHMFKPFRFSAMPSDRLVLHKHLGWSLLQSWYLLTVL